MILTFNVEKKIHFILVLNGSGKQKEASQGLSICFHGGRIKGPLLTQSQQSWQNIK